MAKKQKNTIIKQLYAGITGALKTLRGLFKFVVDLSISVISHIESFIKGHFTQIGKSILVVLSFLFLSINLYVSITLGLLFLVYQVHVMTKDEIAQLRMPEKRAEQKAVLNTINTLPGFSKKMNPKYIETLAREVYTWNEGQKTKEDELNRKIEGKATELLNDPDPGKFETISKTVDEMNLFVSRSTSKEIQLIKSKTAFRMPKLLQYLWIGIRRVFNRDYSPDRELTNILSRKYRLQYLKKHAKNIGLDIGALQNDVNIDFENPVYAGFEKNLADRGYNAPTYIDGHRHKALNFVYSSSDQDKTMVVLIQGTDSKRSEGFMQDLDPNGPGYTAFEEKKEDIVAQIIEEAETKKLEYINIAGHSLGGSLSMLLSSELLKKKSDGKLKYLKGINASLYQSAGVTNDVAEQAKERLQAVEDKANDFSFNVISHTYDYDPVPESGIQIMSDYEGECSKVFMVRRHLTLWSFISTLFSGLSVVARTHNPRVYEHLGFVDKVDSAAKAANEGYVLQYYTSDNEEDRKYIQRRFKSDSAKFLCNETIFKIANSCTPEFWMITFAVVLMSVAMLTLVVNLGFVLFAPGIVSFMNFYYSVLPALTAAIILKETTTHHAPSSEFTAGTVGYDSVKESDIPATESLALLNNK